MTSRNLQILAAVAVVSLALGSGCGDNDNNDNFGGPVRTPTPGAAVRTSTPAAPVPTPTTVAGGGQSQVTFNFNSTASLQGFQIRAAYPAAKGSFQGTADLVACTTTSGGTFTKNDQDATSTLILSIASSSALTFPASIVCTFDVAAGQTLQASDIVVTVQTVVVNGVPGDTTTLTSEVVVAP